MSEFRVLDDTYRDTAVSKRPEYDAIQRGDVVFVPSNGADPHKVANRIRSAFRTRGKSVVTRVRDVDGEKGVIAWLA